MTNTYVCPIYKGSYDLIVTVLIYKRKMKKFPIGWEAQVVRRQSPMRRGIQGGSNPPPAERSCPSLHPGEGLCHTKGRDAAKTE